MIGNIKDLANDSKQSNLFYNDSEAGEIGAEIEKMESTLFNINDAVYQRLFAENAEDPQAQGGEDEGPGGEKEIQKPNFPTNLRDLMFYENAMMQQFGDTSLRLLKHRRDTS